MISSKSVVLVLGLCATLASSQRIMRIETLTADENGAQMTFGEIQIDIFTPSSGSCRINELDAGGNDFQQGALDVFQGEPSFTVFFWYLFSRSSPSNLCIQVIESHAKLRK